MTSEVTEMIIALRDGTMTLEQVAQRFRERSWPRRPRQPHRTYLETAALAEQDPAPYIPGSFDDVIAAHQDGTITDAEYRVLSEAVAEAKRAEDEGGG